MNKNENTIREDELSQLFARFTPPMRDSEAFLEKLGSRLDAVEYLKDMQRAQVRRYKATVLTAFGAGVVVGVILLAFVLNAPPSEHLFCFGIQSAPFLFLEQNSRIITITALSLLLAGSIVSIVYTMVHTDLRQDVWKMQMSLDK